MRRYLLFLILVLISSSVFALSFVETVSNDEDVIYGDEDNKISFTSRWVDASHVVADFSCVDNVGGNKTILGVKKSLTEYEFDYELNDTDGNKVCVINITGYGDVNLTDSSFGVVVDNVDPEIRFPKRIPVIVFDYTNVELKYNITDENGLKEVFVRGNWSGSWESYVPNGILNGTTYSHIINNSYLEEGELVTWDYFAIDRANNEENGRNNKFKVKNRTKIVLDPEVPDGQNGYYVSLPLIILKSDVTSVDSWYRWNSLDLINYNGPFYFNWSNTFGGMEEISYFSEFKDGGESANETIQDKMVKVDITKPKIKDVYPVNDSMLSDRYVNISVLLDDLYEGNSGINESSVVLKLDNNVVNHNILEISDQKSIVSYYKKLNNKEYDVYLYVEDNAGNNNEFNWSFEVDSSEFFDIDIISPINKTYNDRRILIDISLNKKAEEILYKLEKRFKKLCKDCGDYTKKKSFDEGLNSVIVKAVDEYGNFNEKNVSFFIDSKEPRIKSVKPRKLCNGEFLIKYKEENVEQINLYYDNNIVGKSCSSGKNEECVFEVNLSDYEDEEIFYFFEVEDVAGNRDLSRIRECEVDTKASLISINEPMNKEYNNYVIFNISLDSEAKLGYIENGKERKLCSRCDGYGVEKIKKKRFSKGIHNITVFSEDKAGNRDEKEVVFEVI